jgi:hypothetical protein
MSENHGLRGFHGCCKAFDSFTPAHSPFQASRLISPIPIASFVSDANSGWIGFSEDDGLVNRRRADIRRQSRIRFANALGTTGSTRLSISSIDYQLLPTRMTNAK